jgi:hypothetical protein
MEFLLGLDPAKSWRCQAPKGLDLKLGRARRPRRA